MVFFKWNIFLNGNGFSLYYSLRLGVINGASVRAKFCMGTNAPFFMKKLPIGKNHLPINRPPHCCSFEGGPPFPVSKWLSNAFQN